MLEHFFGSKTRVKLLNIFFRSPAKSFYVRELARLAETQLNAVRRELANLVSIGLVAPVAAPGKGGETAGTERSKFYQLRSDSLLFPELKALLLKAQILEEQHLIETVKRRAGRISLFILTGFFTNEPDVETDMLIVGAVKPVVIATLIKSYEREAGRSVRYTLMDSREFRERHELGDKFLYSIFEARHITAVDEILQP